MSNRPRSSSNSTALNGSRIQLARIPAPSAPTSATSAAEDILIVIFATAAPEHNIKPLDMHCSAPKPSVMKLPPSLPKASNRQPEHVASLRKSSRRAGSKQEHFSERSGVSCFVFGWFLVWFLWLEGSALQRDNENMRVELRQVRSPMFIPHLCFNSRCRCPSRPTRKGSSERSTMQVCSLYTSQHFQTYSRIEKTDNATHGCEYNKSICR